MISYFLIDHTKYRSRTDISALILLAASESITRTRAMYDSYLSYEQLADYLTILTENRFLEYERRSQTYKTTEKGLRFLRAYNNPEENMVLKAP
ncbi:MAG: winged helix-turn-helix domain-containing protein, partial [Nitrososphaera sp.]